ncbi:MAG: c-type cytochrome, partial [Alphaproteobacteria bacterium]
FPKGSESGMETEASPKIWEDMGGFEAKLAKYQADTAGTLVFPPTSREELGPVLGLMGGNCKSCHEAYRIKKPQ